ncbi:ferredoxin [Streptomyces sp. NPDC005827]|uniref:ferredoxin n=1 Tax=Streptomyces sp. NPDC005827 TaxID=3157070 RepID=UPI0033D5DE41
MRVEVVRERCEGHGLCGERAPTLYGLDDEGYVTFAYEDRQVPPDSEEAAAAGAGVCPVAALRVRADT